MYIAAQQFETFIVQEIHVIIKHHTKRSLWPLLHGGYAPSQNFKLPQNWVACFKPVAHAEI